MVRLSFKRIRLPAAMRWRLALAGATAVCALLLMSLWIKGGNETTDAFNAGRRLIIKLDDNMILGKQIASPETQVAKEKPEEKTPEPDAKTEPQGSVAATATAAASEPAASGTAAIQKVESNELVNPSAHPAEGSNPDLMEKTPQGFVPTVGKDGTKPWRYYSKPFVYKGAVPMIVIVVTGLGQSKEVTEAAIRLPENVTLSFSPYAHEVESWVASARRAGHELMLDLPLEPANYPAADPGPQALMSTKDPKDMEARIAWLMARAGGYVGFVTQQNENFSQHDEAFKWLINSLTSRGLILVLGREPAQTATRDMVGAKNVASLISDIWVDEELSVMTIQARLSSLEQLALKRGYAVGIARCYPLTIEQIKLWSDRLADKGVMLVPVSAIVRMKFS